MSYEQYRPSRFQLLPEVVKNLLIVNGIVFFATYVLQNTYGLDLAEYFGLYNVLSEKFNYYQLVTHLFLHGSFWHLFSNMFALWMFGNVLENYWGGKRFLIYYMVTGLGAALIHSAVIYFEQAQLMSAVETYLAQPNVDSFALFAREHVPTQYLPAFNNLTAHWATDPSNLAYLEQSKLFMTQLLDLKLNIPTVGASGAVFGVLLAFGMMFPNTVIYLYFAIPIKAKYFVMLYGLFELYSGFANNPADNVAHFAHLGGMLFGFFLVKFWNKRDRKNFY